MQPRTLVPVLVALLVLPVAGLAVPTGSIDDANDRSPEPDGAVAGLDAGAVATQQNGAEHGASGASSAASGAGADARPTEPENVTRLYVDAERPYLRLQPGESETYAVTVENAEDERVELDPHLYVPPAGGPVLDDAWVSIDGPDSLDAGEAAAFEISVAVPEDAEIGRYAGQVAFTDQTMTYPGRPPRPVHAEHVRVEVWEEPVVEIHSPTYVRGQVEAGESITREVVVENTGDEPVPLSPELASDRRTCRGACPDRFEPSWLDVEAPSRVEPGETATVTVTIAPPADAERGRYRTELDLGLKDPNRDERDVHWQTVDLSVQVWSEPDEPVEATFDVSERTEAVTVTLQPREGRYHGDDGDDAKSVDFDVVLVGPDGTEVDAERVSVTDRGVVDLGGDDRRSHGEAVVVRDGAQEFVYRLTDPDAGEWTLRVTPENTIGFAYEITRDEGS